MNCYPRLFHDGLKCKKRGRKNVLMLMQVHSHLHSTKYLAKLPFGGPITAAPWLFSGLRTPVVLMTHGVERGRVNPPGREACQVKGLA